MKTLEWPFELDEVPRDWREFLTTKIVLPTLDENTSESCPVSAEHLLQYLEESGEDAPSQEPIFIRTALVFGFRYWLWQLADAEDYLVVELHGKTVTTSAAEGEGLTPEQFLLWNFLRTWHGWS
jgi:hypothetical protein